MKRTTIMIADDTYDALRRLAERRGLTLSEVVREALDRYVDEGGSPIRRLTFIGLGRTGECDVSLGAEDILGQLLEEDHEGM